MAEEQSNRGLAEVKHPDDLFPEWLKKPMYIYALLDPDTRQAYYVGKSEEPVKRFKAHLTESVRRKRLHEEKGVTCSAKHRWISELADENKEPLLAILEKTGWRVQDWGPSEQRWIRKLSREGHPLLNNQVLRRRKSYIDRFEDALDLGRELFDADV